MAIDSKEQTVVSDNEHQCTEQCTERPTPNFLYIGTSKAGSTWIFKLLRDHPEVFVADSKGLYYFDSHFHHGLDWYLENFEHSDAKIRCEISHSYLYSQEAVGRIQSMRADMKLMVCLREPVERAFSAYLHGVRNGKYPEGTSFEQALETEDLSLIERGRYATHLRPYLEAFGREQIHVGQFDQLSEDPSRFALDLFKFLGVEEIDIDNKMQNKVMPAGRPRSKAFARLAKRLSNLAKKMGLKKLRGRVKASRIARGIIYKPLSQKDKPTIDPATEQSLRDRFRPEVHDLDQLLDTNFVARWNYGKLR